MPVMPQRLELFLRLDSGTQSFNQRVKRLHGGGDNACFDLRLNRSCGLGKRVLSLSQVFLDGTRLVLQLCEGLTRVLRGTERSVGLD
jgi:hypothetical protein